MQKEKILIILRYIIGIGCIIAGSVCISYFIYTNHQIKKNYENTLNNAVILKEREQLIDTSSIDVLDADQEVDSVLTYNNVLEIPSVNILVKINEGIDAYSLATGVGRYQQTAPLCTNGTTVIAGHSSDNYDCIFNDLPNVKLFDNFYIYDNKGVKHTYYVTQTYSCSPYYTEILQSDTSIGLNKTILFCCTNKGHDRYVVEGYEFTEEQFEEYKQNITQTRTAFVDNLLDSFIIENITGELNSFQKNLYDYSSEE